VFNLLDLRAIQELARRTSVSDIRRAYSSVEKDLKKIALHPADNAAFRSRTRIGTVSRLGGSIAGVVLMLLYLFAIEAPNIFAAGGILVISIAAVAIGFVLFAVAMEYKLRKEFVKSYDNVSLPAKRERIRDTTDNLIGRFAARVEKLGRSTRDYPLSLLHKDYRHLILESSKKGDSAKFNMIASVTGSSESKGSQ